MANLLKNYSSILTPVMIILSVLVLIIIICVLFIVSSSIKRAARKKISPDEPQKEEEKDAKEKLSWWKRFLLFFQKKSEKSIESISDEIASSFKQTKSILKNYLGNIFPQYKLPWFLVIGEKNSGKTSLIDGLNIELPIGKPHYEQLYDNPYCKWNFYNQALIIDPRGDLIFSHKNLKNKNCWYYLLSLLNRYRPKRPVDAIILTISCEDLLTLEYEKIEQKTNSIQQQIIHIQHTLGMKLPIYLVLTKTDFLPGFTDMIRCIPENNLFRILGWSNPHQTSVSFNEKWVHSCLDNLKDKIRQIQNLACTNPKKEKYHQGLNNFYLSILKIQQPLEVMINGIFKKNIYHDTYFLRGVYLSSQVQEDSSLGKINFKGSTFVKDLFKEKIFKEFSLASPIRRIFVSNNRFLNILKLTSSIFFILWSVGLYQSNKNLIDVKNNILPYIKTIDTGLTKIQKISSKQKKDKESQYYSEQSIAFMSKISKISTFTFFNPISWFSSLDTKIKKAISKQYELILLPTILKKLLEKSNEFRKVTNRDRLYIQVGDNMNPLETKSFIYFSQFVKNLEQFQVFAQSFNLLSETQSIQDLGALVEYTFGFKIPNQFYKDTQYYKSALEKVSYTPFPILDYKKDIQNKSSFLFDYFLNVAFKPEEIFSSIFSAAAKINDLEQPQNNYNDKNLRLLIDQLKTVKDLINSPQMKWLEEKQFALGDDDFNQIISSIASMPLLGTDLAMEYSRKTDVAFNKLKKNIALIKTHLTDNIFANEDQLPIAQASSTFIGFIELLDTFSKLDFMNKISSPRTIAAVPTEKVLLWNEVSLNKAIQLIDQYEAYTSGDITKAPVKLQTIFKIIAMNAIQTKLFHYISEAQIFKDSPEIEPYGDGKDFTYGQVKNIKTVMPLFRKIIAFLNKGPYKPNVAALKKLLIDESYKLFGRVDRLFDAADLYASKYDQYDWWNGQGRLGDKAYNTKENDYETYFAMQRESLAFYVENMAKPLIKFLRIKGLEIIPSDFNLIAKWENIIDTFSDYTAGKAGNPIQELQIFIKTTLNEMDTLNCMDKTVIKGSSNDYFINIQQNLAKKIGKRCKVLSYEGLKEKYDLFIEQFNTNLSGKFPFVIETHKHDEPINVEEEQLIRFIKLRKSIRPENIKTLDYLAKEYSIFTECKKFLETIDSLMPFLNPIVDPLAQIRITVDFNNIEKHLHLNAGKYIVANYIMLDNYKLTHTNPDMTWNSENNRISVVFEYGKSSLTHPVRSAFSAEDLYIEGKNAFFNLSTNFALLKLLLHHRTNIKDPIGEILKFIIPIDKIEIGPKETRYYLRFRMTTIDPITNNVETLKLPDTIPVVAPALPKLP